MMTMMTTIMLMNMIDDDDSNDDDYDHIHLQMYSFAVVLALAFIATIVTAEFAERFVPVCNLFSSIFFANHNCCHCLRGHFHCRPHHLCHHQFIIIIHKSLL